MCRTPAPSVTTVFPTGKVMMIRKLMLGAWAACGAGLVAACADPVQAPGPALLSVTAPPPAQAQPGAALSPITIRLADAAGTPLPGERVVVEGDGSIVTSDSVTDASGQVEIRWTLPRADDVQFLHGGSFGLEGTHTLRVSTLGGAVREEWSVATAWFRADQMDAAFSYGCGIVDAALWCFGGVPPGLVADGTRAVRPRRITLPVGVVPAEVRVNDAAVCMRNAGDNRPWCATGWTRPAGFRPVPDAPAFVQLVDAGREFCGRTADGVVACWVVRSLSNEDGGFGPVSEVDARRFVQLAGQNPGTFFPTATFACALDTDGDVWCWGTNGSERLGSPGPTASATPVRVPLPGPMADVRVGTEGGCASTATGDTWCWGAYFGRDDFAPRLVTRMGPPGSLIIPAHLELFELWPGQLRADFGGQPFEPFPGLTRYAPITEIVNEGQACARDATRAVFCSWILLFGGGDTSPLTAALLPVPAP